MATAPIAFGNTQQTGHAQLAGAPGTAFNVVVDARGAVRRRPGLATITGVMTGQVDSDGVKGVYQSNLGVLYAVSDKDYQGKIYMIGATAADISSARGQVGGAGRPTFAETEMLVLVASGSAIKKVEILNFSTVTPLGGDPPEATHVVANAQRLMANDSTLDQTKVRYSDLASGTTTFAGHETWSFGGTGISGFFSGEARPDPVVAIGETTNEVFVFGVTNLEIWAPTTLEGGVYARVDVREFGCSAPYSPVKVDAQFAWLDQHRRFILSDGREAAPISGDIQQTLDDIEDTSDCFGYRFVEGPVDCLVWTFPKDGRTFAYQLGAGWSTWMGWDTTANNWARFKVNCHHHRTDTDANVVGTTTGRIRQLTMGALNDGNSEPIKADVTTGFETRDTASKKRCIAVKLYFKRGAVAFSATEPEAYLSYADAPGQWTGKLRVPLGVGGNTDPVVQFRGLGTYYERAWRLEFSDLTADLVLARAEEEYEVLEL